VGLAETAKLAVTLSLKDGLTPGLRNASKGLKSFDQGMGRAGKGVAQLGGALAKVGAVAATAVAAGLYVSAKAAIDKTVDEADLTRAGSSFDELGMALRDMAREMPNTAIELAGIAEQAGALGIKATDIQAFTRQVAILASTTNISADDAATALGQLQNVIGLTGDEFDNFAASLVDLGNKGASTEAGILEIARRSGAAAKLFGIAKDETLGWAAAAANLGMNEELAGTSLQNMFLKAMPTFMNAGELMQKIMGGTAKQIAKAFNKDASGSMEKFLVNLRKLPKAARGRGSPA
jgi:TP901 family phage tail tape measure protein